MHLQVLWSNVSTPRHKATTPGLPMLAKASGLATQLSYLSGSRARAFGPSMCQLQLLLKLKWAAVAPVAVLGGTDANNYVQSQRPCLKHVQCRAGRAATHFTRVESIPCQRPSAPNPRFADGTFWAGAEGRPKWNHHFPGVPNFDAKCVAQQLPAAFRKAFLAIAGPLQRGKRPLMLGSAVLPIGKNTGQHGIRGMKPSA